MQESAGSTTSKVVTNYSKMGGGNEGAFYLLLCKELSYKYP